MGEKRQGWGKRKHRSPGGVAPGGVKWVGRGYFQFSTRREK
jgi:hypothetical protein